MTPDERSFIDAAVTKACATNCYHGAARGALSVAEVDKSVAVQIRNDAARVMNTAAIEFDKAYKRVTDPFLCPK